MIGAMLAPQFLTLLLVVLLQPLRDEASITAYPRLEKASARDRILIVAPHIDDEAIAAAGYAADALRNGADVFVAFLTAGDCNRFSAHFLHRTFDLTATHYLDLGRTRIAEARHAMRTLGVPEAHYFVLGYPDGGLRAIADNRAQIVRSTSTLRAHVPYAEALSPGSPYRFTHLMRDLERVIEIAQPTTVIAPVVFDRHPDHSAAGEITDLALASLATAPRRLGYLVHAERLPLGIFHATAAPPRRARDLQWATYPLSTARRQEKEDLLRSYRSQEPYLALLRHRFVSGNELFVVAQ